MKRSRAATIVAAAPARVLLFAALWLSLFAYAGRPLLIAAAASGIAPAIAWSSLMAISLLPLMTMFTQRLQWVGWMTAALFSLLLTLVFLGDVLRVLSTFASGVVMPDPRTASFTILAAAGVLTFVGLVQARHPRVRRVDVPIENLPEELDGYRIVQWSDVHVGPTIRRCFVQHLVERTNALNADAIAITGDLVDGDVDALRDPIAPLRDLRARDGVFYVTGNHEYYWGAEAWTRELESLGVVFLKNAHRVARRGLVIAGVTDPVSRESDPRAALRGAPPDAVKILLAHRPQAAQAASQLGVHLQLSGHTHGGQFFPFNLFIKWFQPIVAGLHRVGRTWLYVNRGTGYWGPPSRLGVGGEITVVTLRR